MKKSISILSTVLLAFIALVSAEASVEISKPAPAFILQDTEGNTVSLADYTGKVVVLEWTNHECPFVVKHYDSKNMQSLQKKFTKKGVIWLSIISSAEGEQGYVSAAKANELTQSRGAAPTKVLFDPEGTVGHLYGAKTTPHMYIIDEKGVLLYNGGIDSIRSKDQKDIAKAENYVDAGLTSVLAGKAIKMTTSQPYGCSVKYKKT